MSDSTSATAAQLQPPSSVWDRITTWASDNKFAAYTIAGTVVVVSGAGAIYYFSDSKKAAPTEKRKSKKERRKEKKDAEEAARRSGGIDLKDVEAGTSAWMLL
jgi:mitochondrial import receptor subunit TOM70